MRALSQRAEERYFMGRILKVAVLGTGYWAQFQIAAWQAIGCEVTAVWNRTRQRAEDTARRFLIPAVYDTVEELLKSADFDVVDIITDAEAHEDLVLAAARHKKPVICQKPMALTEEACQGMVDSCKDAGVWFAIHENFRYQPQFLALKEQMKTPGLGRVLHAHIQLKSPDRGIISVQPALAQMEHMALRDMGPHLFDVVRYLFGEITSVLAYPVTSYPDIKVDDSVLSLLKTAAGHPVLCTLAHDFNYKAFIAFEHGTLLLDEQNNITLTKEKEAAMPFPYQIPQRLPYVPQVDWDIHGGHVFMAIPACLMDLRDSLLSKKDAPTSGEDNLKTLQTVFAAMRSVETGLPVLTGAV